MRTQIRRTAAIAGLALGAGLAWGTAALAQSVTTDEAAGYVVFPRIVSDSQDIFGIGVETNTVVQLTNTSDEPVVVHCFYVNATGTCSTGQNVPASAGAECRSNDDCVGESATCDPQWTVADFTITLSPQQPTGWVVDTGRSAAGAAGDVDVPPVTSDFFTGELRCIQVNNADDATPVNANDIQGVATIYKATDLNLDVMKYNATGIQAVKSDGTTQNNKQMCLGGRDSGAGDCAADNLADGDDREYAACPAKLVIGHFFEGADVGSGAAFTNVTLSPCSADVVTLEPTGLVVQILVFNEFEQRMSASTKIQCVETLGLDDISNIFEVAVQGTISGQTHLRPVDSNGAGLGMIGLVEEFSGEGTASSHPNNIGEGGVDTVEYVFPVNP